MRTKAINFYRLLKITWFTYQAHKKSGSFHAYVKKVSSHTTEKAHTISNSAVPSRFFLKVQWYKVSTLFLGYLLSDLVGDKLSDIEKKRFVYLGASMGLCDALVDDYKILPDRIHSILLLEEVKEQTVEEQIFSIYYQELLSLIPEEKKELFTATFKNGVAWQIKSLHQFIPHVSEDEVREITTGKGGISILLCSLILDNGSKLNENALTTLGGFIQAMNDAQDLQKDAKEDLKTFVSFKDSFEEVKVELEQYKNRTFLELKKLPLSKKNIEQFAFNFHAMYIGICFKLDTFKGLLNNEFDLNKVKELDKALFKVNMYSLRSLMYCLPKILEFNF